ncbi:hypothetical protein PFFVO_03251 [Plasmodium falciparum Vietnam Oak-Knoll (FVO)]|uniref:Surface antigen n=1 Tax=Plasmodium falciparum Vietnam Oak-Knoll (FVO) TaxID=1036723 RepID=A0A024V5M1_PLAFA|nr:hypothetical protein PFFVO_03251 [Plasmodium falciparum Vietnam Oak-Knoll (FVO)]
MKVHYMNALLFALPLNILNHNERNHNNTTLHTAITRSLCECELYVPVNYDNDWEMKSVMDNFNKQTQQRFEEYDERMKTTRQKCKEQCDKEIQKIILKDKLEKELMDKFATLQTDIQSDAIPTCVCEKSLEDKMEKECLKCAQNLGGIVAPSTGVLAGIAEGALYVWKDAEIIAAKAAAVTEGAAKGLAEGAQVGINAVMDGLCRDFGLSTVRIKELGSVINGTNYSDVKMITEAVYAKFNVSCLPGASRSGGFTVAASDQSFCSAIKKSKNYRLTSRNYCWSNYKSGY